MFLSFNRVIFTYQGAFDPIFEDLRLTLGAGWTGVVGANGTGKTTLLRLALGDLQPTQGHIVTPGPGVYCPQRTDLEPPDLQALLATRDSEAQRLVGLLGLQPDWGDRWETLSHGERKRAQIAVMLHQNPVFLAVDEPTNHLDREARDQVWRALESFRGIGLLVSHDRDLMDDLCGQCLFLDPPNITLRPGGYSDGAQQAMNERTALLRQRTKVSREVEQLQQELHIRREQAAKAERQRSRHGLAKGDHDAKAKVNAARVSDSGSGQRLRQLEGRLQQASDRGTHLEVRRQFSLGVTLGGERCPRKILWSSPESQYPLSQDRRLWCPALIIHPDDRIGIQGPNGAGKSTFIRRIVADLMNKGERFAYIPQEIDALSSTEILEGFKRLPPDRLGKAMTLVRRLGSDPARLLQSQEPSPGELRKLLLATSIESNPRIVILDEPTNHLDLPSVECLEEALAGCEAALVMVSHDRRFLAKLVRRFWCIQSNGQSAWELNEQVALAF